MVGGKWRFKPERGSDDVKRIARGSNNWCNEIEHHSVRNFLLLTNYQEKSKSNYAREITSDINDAAFHYYSTGGCEISVRESAVRGMK